METLYINELLCYSTFYFNNSCNDNIIKIINNFYTSDEILEAKKLLWEICNNELPHFSLKEKILIEEIVERQMFAIFLIV